MAKKDKSDVLGKLLIAVIPLIGIVWAGVAGIVHNGNVKDAKAAEEAFEVKFVQKVNELEQVKEKNITIEELNITSILPTFYSSKLSGDTVSTNNSSYTVKIGANPTTVEVTNKDGSVDTIVEKFGFEMEFFISQNAYAELNESYEQSQINTKGYKDYVYTTYSKNNPKNSVIYPLDNVFNKYHKNVLSIIYDDEIIVGANAEYIIDLIDSIPTTLEASKAALSSYKELIANVKAEYSLLNEEQKAEVENYSKLAEAEALYAAKVVQFDISELPAVEDFTASTNTKLNNVRKAYNKLTDAQKQLVENYDVLLDREYHYAIWFVEYYIEAADEAYSDTFVKNAVDNYNALSNEQKLAIDSTLLSNLEKHIETYNNGKDDNKKLTLKKPE